MVSAESAKRGDLVVEISPGELIDKITILNLKAERIADPEKLANVRHERALLQEVRAKNLTDSPELARLEAELKTVNETLWQIEDDIRRREAAGDFGAGFIELARSVYGNNDRRAALKREIGALFGTEIVEEKSYART